MKAIVHDSFGSPDALRLEEVDKPVPKRGEVLIRVRAAALNPLDWHLLRGSPAIIRLIARLFSARPFRIGRDVAGEIEAVGPGVERFRPGDAVFGTGRGSFAEYACAKETWLAPKPGGVSFEQAAALGIAGQTALQALRRAGGLQPGQKLLINGAGGGVGTFAVQMARIMGARVTAVCGADKVATVRALGPDRVIDYSREDFTRGEARHDLILDLISNRRLAELRRVLAPRGRIVVVGGGTNIEEGDPMLRVIGGALRTAFSAQKQRPMLSRADPRDLQEIAGWVEAGALDPVIGAVHPLRDAAAAMRELATGHARGKILLVP